MRHSLREITEIVLRKYGKPIPDAAYLSMQYWLMFGAGLNLKDPKSFNEKLQWLKLHDRSPLYTTLVDKLAVKQWVIDRIGEEYVTPSFGYWDRAELIDLSKLPSEFVLKTNHDCGGVVICRDKESFCLNDAIPFLNRHLKRNYYWGCREWPYKNVHPMVFAEQYLQPECDGDNVETIDYKFYCFNGKPEFLYVSQGLDKHETARISFLTLDWAFADFKRHDYYNFEVLPEKPRSFNEMERLARLLSEGIPFVRVDFFEYKGRPRFSEMTLTPCGGFMQFDPPEWDLKVGSLLDLSSINN